jgi:hypothetical protein
MWWLYFRRGGKLVGVAIIEAPTLYHARTRVAVRGIGKAADYSDAKKNSMTEMRRWFLQIA